MNPGVLVGPRDKADNLQELILGTTTDRIVNLSTLATSRAEGKNKPPLNRALINVAREAKVPESLVLAAFRGAGSSATSALNQQEKGGKYKFQFNQLTKLQEFVDGKLDKEFDRLDTARSDPSASRETVDRLQQSVSALQAAFQNLQTVRIGREGGLEYRGEHEPAPFVKRSPDQRLATAGSNHNERNKAVKQLGREAKRDVVEAAIHTGKAAIYTGKALKAPVVGAGKLGAGMLSKLAEGVMKGKREAILHMEQFGEKIDEAKKAAGKAKKGLVARTDMKGVFTSDRSLRYSDWRGHYAVAKPNDAKDSDKEVGDWARKAIGQLRDAKKITSYDKNNYLACRDEVNRELRIYAHSEALAQRGTSAAAAGSRSREEK